MTAPADTRVWQVPPGFAEKYGAVVDPIAVDGEVWGLRFRRGVDAAPHLASRPATDPKPCPLTARQLAVLRLIADGLQNSEIADELGLSAATVKTHVRRLFAAIGDVHDRANAVLIGCQRGWIA